MNISEIFGKIKKGALVLTTGGLMLTGLSSCATPSYPMGDLRSPDAINTPREPNGQVSDFWNPDILEGNEALVYPYGSYMPMKGDGLLLRGPSEDWRNYRQPDARAHIYKALSKDFFNIEDCAIWKSREKPTDKKQKGTHGTGLNQEELQMLMQTMGDAASPETPYFKMPVVLATALDLIDGLPYADPTRVSTANMVAKMANRYWKITEALKVENPDFENPFQMRVAHRWRRQVNKRDYIETARGDAIPLWGEGYPVDKAYRDLDQAPMRNDMQSVEAASNIFLSYAQSDSEPANPVAIDKDFRKIYKESVARLEEHPYPENLLPVVAMQAQLPAKQRLPKAFIAKQISKVGVWVAENVNDYIYGASQHQTKATQSHLNKVRNQLFDMNESVLKAQEFTLKTSMNTQEANPLGETVLTGEKALQFHRALEKGAQKLMLAMDKAGQENPLEKFQRQQKIDKDSGLGLA